MGVLITAGLTQKRRITDHWACSPDHDYVLVRACMPRDLFLLFYSRFFHMAPPVGNVDKKDPNYDSKYHIRRLEEVLNAAWSTLADPGAWLSYDEQMVKSTAKAMTGILRFNKAKPIKHGIKGWSICCPSGYCFVQSIDGGFMGDPDLRTHKDCPLGHATRTVLHVMLGICPTFSAKIIGSGITVAMDNFFTSAALLLALATRDIFAVGTLRSNWSGLDGAMKLWNENDMTATKRGDMMLARSPVEIAIVTWIDSQVVNLLTTKHIFEEDWVPLAYTRREAGTNGESTSSLQPKARKDYVANMGGVDVADQRLGAHAHDHKPMTFFWRRVFDQKFFQAVSNAFLIFRWWAEVLHTQCKAVLSQRHAGSDVTAAAGGMGACDVEDVAEGSDLDTADLEDIVSKLAQLMKTERVEWDTRLARHLMAKCSVGNADKGARRTRKSVPEYCSTGAKTSKVCRGGKCAKPAECESQYRSTKTHGVCWCAVCSNFKGKERALHLCTKCQKCEEAHLRAASDAAKRKYVPIRWA